MNAEFSYKILSKKFPMIIDDFIKGIKCYIDG